jgi:hypothetical protein
MQHSETMQVCFFISCLASNATMLNHLLSFSNEITYSLDMKSGFLLKRSLKVLSNEN